jgi:purine catabolism regulator
VIPEPLPLTREGFLRRERVASVLRHRLQTGRHRPLLTTNLNFVAFLVPEVIDVAAVWRAIGDPAIALLVGRAHAGTRGVRRSYKEAQSLLGYRDDVMIKRFDDALVPRVLMGDAGAREAFIDDLLGPLQSRKGGEAMKTVLLTYARTGFNFRLTAQRLGIHPNTLRYRLNRAMEVLAFRLDDPDVRFRLQLAARILDFLHNA